MAASVTARADPVRVRASQVALSEDNPEIDRVESLIYLGGLELTSPDPRFGGLSALDVSADGTRLVAVGDEGIWFTARIGYDRRGRLANVTDGDIRPLLDARARPFRTKALGDAESVARLADGSYVVSFERVHRLVRYAKIGGPGQPFPAPAFLSASPPNRGAEAMTRLQDGNLLIFSEGLEAKPGIAAGWIGTGRNWRAVGWKRTGIYVPVGAATRDDGTVFVLERRFTVAGGVGTRVSVLARDAIRPGKIFQGREIAQLFAPLVHDNFEGISVRRDKTGRTLIYLISDNNFSSLQHTYLLLFALAE